MWITFAYERSSGMVWLCTISPDKDKALSEMKADKKILEHQAFDVMSASFRYRLCRWFQSLGIKETEIPDMIEAIFKNIINAADTAMKTAHRNN